jgi:beta-glucosidase
MKKKTNFWRGATAGGALLLSVGLFMTAIANEYSGNINSVLGIESGAISGTTSDLKYSSDYGELSDANLARLIADEQAFCKREMEEGAVLLKNADNALPFTSDIKNITLFGRASADPVYKSHAGGGVVSGSTAITFKAALEAAGYNVNGTLYNAYANSSTARVKGSSEGKSDIGEEKSDFYTDTIKDSFKNFSDAAIVVLSRDSGEGQDFNTTDIEGVPQLALHDSEKDMLKMIHESGFKKIIVLINSGNAMEVDWLDNEEYGADACMWIGEPGRYGFPGVVSLLNGEATPSGHLVDTYATNSLSAPAMMNFGDFTFSGDTSSAMANKYVVYEEGVYVGYKYYETRYEDCVLNQGGASSTAGTYASSGNWNYAEEVSYPFGYGLSYASFTQTLDSFTYNGTTDEFTAKVTVKNTSETYSGRSVAELYLQSPYTEYDKANGVEKPSVQIVGFAKTDILAPGATQQLTITVDRYLIASYDYSNAKTYILDDGTYYFGLGDNAHDALNNILAAKGATGMTDIDGTAVSGDKDKVGTYEVTNFDKTTYATSRWTDAAVTNKYVGDYAINANDFYDDDPVTYLTRNDWANTYPKGASLAMNDAIQKAEISRQYSYDASSTAKITNDQINGVDLGEDSISFLDMYGVDYDDAKWDTFLSQLSLQDMATIISDSLGQGAITTVNKPANKNADGPDGYGMNYRYGDQDSPTCYVIQNLAVSTWNVEIMKLLGNFYGEDCIYSRGQMAWAPGLDIHRTPYGGRNFEYSSEDGLFTSLMNSVEIKAMQNKGVIASPKHLYANDQETNRSGACTFMTEQTARESGLRAFELCYTLGGAGGSMLAMNRIGCKMSPVAATTLTGILREEWGFKGILVTDSSGSESEKIPTADSLIAGTGMFCLARRTTTIYNAIYDNSDSYLYSVLKETNHRYYYNYVNSTLVNGLTNDSVVADTTPWWQFAIVGVDAVLATITIASAWLFVTNLFVKEEKKVAEPEANEPAEATEE